MRARFASVQPAWPNSVAGIGPLTSFSLAFGSPNVEISALAAEPALRKKGFNDSATSPGVWNRRSSILGHHLRHQSRQLNRHVRARQGLGAARPWRSSGSRS